MFPFHTWLPDAHTDAPTAGSVILAAVLLKMGTYGFLRFSLPILPDATRHFVPMMVVLSHHRHRLRRARRAGAEGLEAARRLLLGQPHGDGDARACSRSTRSASPAASSSSSITASRPARSSCIVGIVYERRHTREISEYGGLSKVMPVYAAIFLDHDDVVDRPAGAERLHRRAADPAGRVRRAARSGRRSPASGVVLGAAYMLYLYQRTMFGKIENPKNERLLGPEPARVRDVRAAARPRGLDGALSGAVPAPARHVGAAHHRARQPAVRAAERATAADCDAGAPPPRAAPAPRRRRTVPATARAVPALPAATPASRAADAAGGRAR